MERIINDLKSSFKRGNIVIQFIYINVGVFVLTSLLAVIFLLFNKSVGSILRIFELPAWFHEFIFQPWSLFTYMFMHSGILHILFNMLWLYWFGMLFLHSFSAKHLRGVYVLSGICGGLLYMLAYNIFPYFTEVAPYSYLLGASASVLGIVVATAYRMPNYTVNLLFLGAIRLKYIALFMIVTDLMFMTSDNAGGHISHLGGALAGLWFAAELSKGRDITGWINKILDWFTGLFNRKPKAKKPRMKVHYGSKADDYNYNAKKKADLDEIDRILDKLKKSGYDSLSSEEKKRLFDASKK